jgi:hypothetical protein
VPRPAQGTRRFYPSLSLSLRSRFTFDLGEVYI